MSRLLLALSLALAACSTPAASVEPEREPGVEPRGAGPDAAAARGAAWASALACEVTLADDGEVLVDGHATGRSVGATGGMRVRAYPLSEDEILLAFGSDAPWWAAFMEAVDPSAPERLWIVACDSPEQWRVHARLEGADFAWGAPARGGGGLYFSLGAVHYYDFAARDHGPISARPEIETCWMGEGPVAATEYVEGWIGEDRLLVYWGGPCGFEAEWVGGTAVIEDPAGAARRRPSAWVGAVVADAKGRVWVGDGGNCSEPQTLWDRGSPGLWRSEDRGRSWDFVEIPALAGRQPHGVEAIVLDPAAPGRIGVRAECCYPGPRDHCEGGELLRSEDGGRSWTQLEPEATRDALAAKELAEAPQRRSAQLGDQVLEGTRDGVLRRAASEPEGTGEIVLLPGVTDAASGG